jgi:hypothetical protein
MKTSMKADIEVRHEFVEYIPGALEDRVVYVSIPFATSVHKCMCGCGKQVVTPLTPTDWKLTFDGDTISLDPSIGNWSFDCRSHYWITRDRVKWSYTWSRTEIERGRESDRLEKEKLFSVNARHDTSKPVGKRSIWRRFKGYFG